MTHTFICCQNKPQLLENYWIHLCCTLKFKEEVSIKYSNFIQTIKLLGIRSKISSLTTYICGTLLQELISQVFIQQASTSQSSYNNKNMQEEHPFVGDKQIFIDVKKEDRSAYLKKILSVPQSKEKAPEYSRPFPNSAKWQFMGNELHYHYAKKENPSAVFFYFHGLNAHGGGAGYYAMNLVDKCGVDAYALDFTNFGQSKGPFRGYFQSVDNLVVEAHEFMKHILEQYPEKKKVYISGLSLGGAISFWLALKNPGLINGVIFLSPAFRGNYESQPFMKKVGWLMGKVFPRLLIVPQKFNEQNRLDVAERIQNDPYLYKDKVVPGSIKAVLDAMDGTEAKWSEFTTPYILIQSGCDKLVDPFQAIDFQNISKSEDKTVIYCKDMWHAVFGEPEIPDLTNIVVSWLNKRLK